MTKLNQRIKLNQPGSQLTLEVGPDKLSIPAVAVPVAWLLQLYAALDGQANVLPLEMLKEDLLTIFVRHANLHRSELTSINSMELYNYKIYLADDLDRISVEELSATDDAHAIEEAGYEFDEEVASVERGDRIPDPPPVA